MMRIVQLFKRFYVAALLAGFVLLCPDGIEDDPDAPTVHFLISRSQGTLVICGGGDISDDVMLEFIDAAGGEAARIVVVTTASEMEDSEEIEEEMVFWRAQKLARLTVMHTRSREEANDPEHTSLLEDATGVWFVGGQQSLLADTYLGTLSERMIHDIFNRGGVVGGISAGAAIMSSVMIRDGDLHAKLGRGFGLLPGTVIDQHFVARNRQGRLIGALEAHPGLVGLGIDEYAGVVIRGGKMVVVGDSVVACISHAKDRSPIVETLRPGDQANLAQLSRSAGKLARVRPMLRAAAHDATGGD
jgi:cyanophycinase